MEVIEVNYRKPKRTKIPKTNFKYLEEVKARECWERWNSLEQKWATTGLLDAIDDKFTRQVTAVLLENQRLMNEKSV
jgi:hypothetical protein